MKLAGAVSATELPVTAHWVDVSIEDQSIQVIGECDAQSSGANVVTIVPAPPQGVVRTIKYISVYNADSAAATPTVRYNNNGTTRIIIAPALATGSTLEYTD